MLIFEMLMKMRVIMGELFFAHGGSAAVGRIQVGLPRSLRTDRANRNQLFQILPAADGARRCWRRMQDQVFKLVPAVAAFVFVERHRLKALAMVAITL